MIRKNKVFLNEKVVKKLIKNKKYGKILSAKVISGVIGADYEEIYNSITLSSEEIAFNALTVNSTADGIYYNDTMYFNIEFNFYGGTSKEKQILSYCYQLYLGQLHTYENYHDIKKIIQISIDTYDILGLNKFMYKAKLMEENLHIVFDDSIEIVHINLDFLNKISYDEVEKSKDKLMKILYFLVCDDEKKVEELYGDDELMKKVIEEAKEIAGIEKMHLYLTDEQMQKQDQEYYYEQGIKQGVKRGIEQRDKDIVLNMMKKKYSFEDIAEITNLSIPEINKMIYNG